MRIKYLSAGALTRLRAGAKLSPSRYDTDAPWLPRFFGETRYALESSIEIEQLPVLKNPTSPTDLYELENSKAVFLAFRGLSPSQAADERLWAWLCHEPYWEYMRARWPVRATNAKPAYVYEHYFLGDTRALVRNGLARLWWFAYCTYDEERENPFELTEALLRTTDARQSLTERQFWRNRSVLHSFLNTVARKYKAGVDLYTPREDFRSLCKRVNLAGGSLLLDALEPDSVVRLVENLATEIRPTPAEETQ